MSATGTASGRAGGVGRNIFLPLLRNDGVLTLEWHGRGKIDVAAGRHEQGTLPGK